MPLGLRQPSGGVAAAVFVSVFVSVFYVVAGFLCHCCHAAVRFWPGLIGSASSEILGVADHPTSRSVAGFGFRPGWGSPSASLTPPRVQPGFRHHPPQTSSWISSNTVEFGGFASPRVAACCASWPAVPPPVRLSPVSCLLIGAVIQICPVWVWICFETFGLSRAVGLHKPGPIDIQKVSSRANILVEPWLTLSQVSLQAEPKYPTLFHNAPTVTVSSNHSWNPGVLMGDMESIPATLDIEEKGFNPFPSAT